MHSQSTSARVDSYFTVLSRFAIRIQWKPVIVALKSPALATVFLAVSCAGRLFADDADQLQAPPGFVVTQYADDRLAHDIFSMTIDALGRVVVSGPGYVRILVDSNNDGVADSFKQFADGPKTGAQGMFFLGRDLFCTGDAGLLRFRDKNADDRADGPPEVFLRLKTGGEHFAHSVQKGPDGWWYLVVGNEGHITRSYATGLTSPVKEPRAGTVIRLKPDLSGGEVVSDGMRNAYDFAFNGAGDLFTFDSDNEREVSLPFYRPIRILHILPGSDAGWVSQSWIRPTSYPDAPPTVAAFGRGSPTGVVCYRHTQFPSYYHDGLFALDWTFGRVLAVRLTKDGAGWRAESAPFLTPKGEFGFAPTDVEVGPDGSLYVCVGGRGTRGAVYRVEYKGLPETTGESSAAANDTRQVPRPGTPFKTKFPLALCLMAPQPQSSWSRAIWIPEAKKLGRDAFLMAAFDSLRSTDERVRALEIVTELFGGIDAASLAKLATDESSSVRARAIWSAGRSSTTAFPPDALKPYLDDVEPWVARAALEAIWTVRIDGPSDALLSSIVRRLGDGDRAVRFAAARLIGRLDDKQAEAIRLTLDESNLAARLWFAFGRCERTTRLNLPAVQTAIDVFEKADSSKLRLEALRVMQIALGDCGPGHAIAPMFDGYTSRLDLTAHERQLDPTRIHVAKLFPTRDADVDFELARVIAMLAPANGQILDQVLAQITPESDPVRDIHYLTVAGRIHVERNSQESEKIAQALVSLEPKIVARKLNQDLNWDVRVTEMYKQLVALDEDLPAAIVGQKEFGRPGHVLFLSEISPELLKPAIDAFLKRSHDDPQFKWTNGIVFLLGESPAPEHRELIRQKYADFSLRSAVVMTLAQKPEEADRPKFDAGLESSQLEVVAASVVALEKLPPIESATERIALVAALRRLVHEKPEFVLRERVAKLLARSAKDDFGFIYGEAGHRQQPEVVERADRWLQKTHPAEFAQASARAADEQKQVGKLLADVNWGEGDAPRGRKLFESRTCAQCHGGSSALGPDLSGAARRFSREDLFTAIVQPSRDVSPRYQATMIQTTSGQVYTGMIVYEAVDGVLLRTAANQTIRVKPSEIEERRALKTSLMPEGLLKDLHPSDVADLYTYLRSLGGEPVATGPSGHPN
jgi:putative membrane-bound dehydrogenase-like protein